MSSSYARGGVGATKTAGEASAGVDGGAPAFESGWRVAGRPGGTAGQPVADPGQCAGDVGWVTGEIGW